MIANVQYSNPIIAHSPEQDGMSRACIFIVLL